MKQLHKGLIQMAEEGAVQLFRPLMGSDYILGAVGVLQFEVTMARLAAEYGVDAIYQDAPYKLARWVECDDAKIFAEFQAKFQASLALDAEEHLAYLCDGNWRLTRTMELYPDVIFHKTREHT
jgi:peptide chain release factor 3